jgi:hypothetical protein
MGTELMVVAEPREGRLVADLALDSMTVLDSITKAEGRSRRIGREWSEDA